METANCSLRPSYQGACVPWWQKVRGSLSAPSSSTHGKSSAGIEWHSEAFIPFVSPLFCFFFHMSVNCILNSYLPNLLRKAKGIYGCVSLHLRKEEGEHALRFETICYKGTRAVSRLPGSGREVVKFPKKILYFGGNFCKLHISRPPLNYEMSPTKRSFTDCCLIALITICSSRYLTTFRAWSVFWFSNLTHRHKASQHPRD